MLHAPTAREPTVLTRFSRLCPALLLLCGASCAHLGSQEQADPGPRPVWPAPPLRPQVRWATSFPSAYTPKKGTTSRWRRAWDLILGIQEAPVRREPLLARPFGLAVADGRLLVADPDGGKVLRIDWRRGDATPVVCPSHEWEMPMAVAVGPDQSVYIADASAGVVIRIEPSGACAAIGHGALERPTGVAIAAGRVYVVDPPRHTVVAFSPEGHELLRFGGRGDGDGELNFPTSIAPTADGQLLVVDALNFRIVRYSLEGRYLTSFGGAGDGDGAFGRPKAVATDERGGIWVSDSENNVVILFASSGAFAYAVGGTDGGRGGLSLPAGVAVGAGFLYVADSYNHRIQIFELLGGEP